MRRFSFFFAVFSVGLVMFLLFTGQMGRLFKGQSGDNEKPSWVPLDSQQDDVGDLISFTKKDFKAGRVQFKVTGEFSEGFGINVGDVNAPRVLTNAVITVPIKRPEGTPADQAPLTSMSEIVLRVGEIVVRDQESRTINLSKGIVGEGNDGTYFETDDAVFEYNGPAKQAQLDGVHPIKVSFPTLQISGRGGFSAIIDSALGLTHLIVRPPVVVAVSHDRGGALLGFAENRSADQKVDSQIFLLGDGALVIDRQKREATFKDHVLIYQAPKTALLTDPPEPRNIQLECEELKLQFEPETLRFIGAQAFRGEEPVRAKLQNSYELSANGLKWIEGDRAVVMEGGVRLEGELGVFGAETARLVPHERRCFLDGQVYARFRAFREPSDGDPKNDEASSRTIRELGGDWILAADHAEFTGSPSREATGRTRLQKLKAYSDTKRGIRITQSRSNGARIVGTTLLYDGEQDILKIVGPGSSGGPRPVFTEGPEDRNQISSDSIEMRFAAGELFFVGTVESVIHDLPFGDQEKLPTWLQEHGSSDNARLWCDSLRLGWSADRQLGELEALAEPKNPRALGLRYQGKKTFQLEGRRLYWVAADQQILLSGNPAHLDYEQSLVEVDAELIRFRFDEMSIYAEDSQRVLLVAREDLLPKSEALGNSGGTAHIGAPKVRVVLNRNESNSGTEKSSAVESVRAWNDRGGAVEMQHGSLVAAGEDVLWNAVEQRLELTGKRRQRIERIGTDGGDELTAKTITVDLASRHAILEGDVKARIRQQLLHAKQTTGTAPAIAWDITAGRLEAYFSEITEVGDSGRRPKKRLVLDRLEARDRVTLTNASAQIWFEGTACDWDRSTQQLVISDPDDRGGVQTLRHGGGSAKNDIRAREIRITGNPQTVGKGRLWVFLIDEVVANFSSKPREDRSSRGPNGDSFRVIAENLLVELLPSAEDGKDYEIHNAYVWDGVNFQSGDYSVLAYQAIYRSRDREISFLSRKDGMVQLIRKNLRSLTYSKVGLRQRPDGGWTVETEGGSAWSGQDVRSVLDMINKAERAPAQQ